MARQVMAAHDSSDPAKIVELLAVDGALKVSGGGGGGDSTPAVPTIITGGDPAAGSEAFIDVGVDEYLEVLSVCAVLVADDTEAVRTACLKLLDGPDGNVLALSINSALTQAEETGTTSWAAAYGGPGGVFGGSIQGSSLNPSAALPSCISVAPPASRIITFTENLAPGDNYGPLRVLCRQHAV